MSKLPIPFPGPTTYEGHSGVDFPEPLGTPIPASGPGRVTALSTSPRGGYWIWVLYDNGTEAGYCHMDSHRGCPPVGSRVSAGTRLGYVGNTGNSTGPHLHMEVSGYATTAGFWRHFSTTVVGSGGGSGASNGAPINNDDSEIEDMIVNIQGKAGVRSGGAYFISNGRATFLGGTVAGAPTLTFDQGTALKKTVSGI